MPIKPLSYNDNASKPRELCPEGTFQAEIIRAYYCGLQPNPYNTDRPQEKIVLSFELDEPMTESDGNFILSTTQTYSIAEKANLRKLFAPVLGSAFPSKPGQSLDIDALIGMKVMLTVSHTHKDDGRVYANIASLARLPRGMAPFEGTQDVFSWSCDDANDPNTDKVPGWIKELSAKRLDDFPASTEPVRPAQRSAPPAARKLEAAVAARFDATQVDPNDIPF